MPGQEIAQLLTNHIMTEVASAPPASAPTPDFPIIEAGLVDSLGLFKLIAFIEEEFQVKIASEDILFENFATINAITSLIQAKLSARVAGGI